MPQLDLVPLDNPSKKLDLVPLDLSPIKSEDTTDINQFVGPTQPPEYKDKWGIGPANYGPNTESFLSHEFLPEMKQPETWMGGFAKGLYDEFLRPLSSPRNILSSIITGKNLTGLAHDLAGSGALNDVAQASARDIPLQHAPAQPDLMDQYVKSLPEGPVKAGTPWKDETGNVIGHTTDTNGSTGFMPVTDDSGRVIAPPQNNITRPPGPWDTMNVSQDIPQAAAPTIDEAFSKAVNKPSIKPNPMFGSDYGEGYAPKQLDLKPVESTNIPAKVESTSEPVKKSLNIGTTVLVNPEKMTPELLKKAKEQGFDYIGTNDEGKIRLKKVSNDAIQQPVLETEVGNARPTAARSKLGPVVDARQNSLLSEIINFPRTVLASNDMSAPLRQGIGLIHKKEFWNALPDMVKAFKDEGFYQKAQQDILDRPLFKPRMGIDGKEIPSFAQDAGLKLTDLVDISNREESRMSSLAEKYVPNVRRSDRAYTLFLNKLRADTFESLVNNSKVFGADASANLPLARDLASFVNNATGRGSLKFGKVNLEQSATALNNVLFSPRLIASRLQMMNPANYVMGNPVVRKEYLKSLFAIAALGNTITTLGKMAGGKVEYDPASADFGKLRIGNTRIDPYGGFQQYIVAAQRLLPNLKKLGLANLDFGANMKSTTTGKEYSLMNPRYGQSNQGDVLERFIRGKETPVLGFAHSFLKNRTELSGQKMDFTNTNPFKNSIAQRFIPMLIQDLYEVGTQAPQHLPWMIPDAFGMSIQQYGGQPNAR